MNEELTDFNDEVDTALADPKTRERVERPHEQMRAADRGRRDPRSRNP